MARQESVVCEAVYPDGRNELRVRIRIDISRLDKANLSSGNSAAIEGARNSICIQVKQAIAKKYRTAPSWIDWEYLQLDRLAQLPPTSQTRLF